MINIVNTKKDRAKFEDLLLGTVFTLNDEIFFIKIPIINIEDEKSFITPRNAMNIQTGYTANFSSTEMVFVPQSCDLKINW